MHRTGFLLAVVLVIGCASAPRQESADLILAGGRVFTGNPSRPWAEAVAIRGEMIAAVGSDAEVRALAGPSTRVVELGGKLVIPGINDAHIHAPWMKDEGIVVDVPQEGATIGALLDALRAAAASAPAGARLAAELPLHLVDAGLTRDDLDAISTSHRIHVAPLGGHSAVLNTPALRAWGIADDAANPAGGSYGRNSAGRLNGWIYEHAKWAPERREQSAAGDEAIVASIRAMEEFAIRHGITTFQAMPLIDPERIERLIVSVEPRVRWRIINFRLAPYDGSPGRFPVKYILDGTPIERSAALRAPYADDPSARGALNYSRAEIEAMVWDAARGERQLLLHATGDLAIAEVLDAMKRTPADWPALRVRIEHGDYLAPDQLALARELGVTIVQNPSHFMLGPMAPARLGPERHAYAQMARSHLEGGIPFAIGSDGPPDPFLNIFFAAIHPGNRAEALSVEQGVRAYTAGAARAELQETRKGTIAPGRLADLAVLSQDIFAVPPPQIPGTTSVMTIVGGKVVWEP